MLWGVYLTSPDSWEENSWTFLDTDGGVICFSPPARRGSLDLSGHCRTSTASSRAQREVRIQRQEPDVSGLAVEVQQCPCQKRMSDRMPQENVRIECQIECQNRMSENICHIYIIIYIYFQMRCQKLWQNKSSRWGSLEVKYLWIAPVVTKHVLSFSFGAMPNALWMCELRRSPENQLWQASFSGNAEYILPKQRMKRKVCDTHISSPWCWHIKPTRLGDFLRANVGFYIPAPWFAYGMRWA